MDTSRLLWNERKRIGKPAHEDKLIEVLKEYEDKGYKVIKLNGKSPDGIVFKNGKAICIEILPKKYNPKRWQWDSSWTVTGKRNVYEGLGFDEIEIIPYKVPK
jgi:hypothetical protein